MEFWEELPLNDIQETVYRSLSISDVFRLEMARYKLGFNKYEDWIKYLEHTPGIIDAVEIPINTIPTPSQYGQLVYHLRIQNIRDYFLKLVNECATYKLVDFKTIIWDGRLLESFCAKNKNKKLSAFADIEAGKCKHIISKKIY